MCGLQEPAGAVFINPARISIYTEYHKCRVKRYVFVFRLSLVVLYLLSCEGNVF